MLLTCCVTSYCILHIHVYEDTLRTHFEAFGEVAEVRIMFDRGTGKPRGFGFVVFEDTAAAEKAAEGISAFPSLYIQTYVFIHIEMKIIRCIFVPFSRRNSTHYSCHLYP